MDWKSRFFALCFLLAWKHQVTAITIDCQFYETTWSQASWSVYFCQAINTVAFDGSHLRIDGATGGHLSGKSNSAVKGFIIYSGQNIKRFPTNLENVFEGLVNVGIEGSKLAEITKDDLKVFPDLKFLSLKSNIIKSIRQDTFELNPFLEIAFLSGNRISHIDAQTFSSLKNLRVLLLSSNACSSLSDADSRSSVETLISKIDNNECMDPDHTTTTTTTENPLLKKLRESEEKVEEISKKLVELEARSQQCKLDLTKHAEENQKLEAELQNVTKISRDVIKQNEELSQVAKASTVLEETVKEIMLHVSNILKEQEHLSTKFDKLTNKCSTDISKLSEKLDQQSTLTDMLHEKDERLNVCQIIEKNQIETQRDTLQKDMKEIENALAAVQNNSIN